MAVENINILCLCQHRAPVCSSIPINQSRNVTTSHSETHKMYQEKDFYIKHETTLNHTAGSILSNIIHLETTWMPWANVYFHESKQCWISLIVTEVFKIFIWKKYVQTNHRRESKCSSDSTFLDGGRARKMVRLCVYAMVIFFDFQITEPIREMLWWSTLVDKKKKKIIKSNVLHSKPQQTPSWMIYSPERWEHQCLGYVVLGQRKIKHSETRKVIFQMPQTAPFSSLYYR